MYYVNILLISILVFNILIKLYKTTLPSHNVPGVVRAKAKKVLVLLILIRVTEFKGLAAPGEALKVCNVAHIGLQPRHSQRRGTPMTNSWELVKKECVADQADADTIDIKPSATR